MGLVRTIFVLGVIFAALLGFFCPFWWLGFAPLAAGSVWYAYNLVELPDPTSRPQ